MRQAVDYEIPRTTADRIDTGEYCWPVVSRAAESPNATPGASEPAPGPHGLVVRCFGHFEVLRNGCFVNDWRRDKSKALLKLLIAHHGSIKRDVLLELLWPELEPDPALRNLRVTLHAL